MKRVNKFLVTIIDDPKINIDDIHEALSKITNAYLSTWNEDKQELRTRIRISGDKAQ